MTMRSSDPQLPGPTVTAVTQPFWNAADDEQLILGLVRHAPCRCFIRAPFARIAGRRS